MKHKITEADSVFESLEKMSTMELLQGINQEDQKVAIAVGKAIPQIIPLIEQITLKMIDGGRLFYIGAGTSGRLGIVDASECPPTYGIEQGKVIGLIAGGDAAIRKAVEFAEDNPDGAWEDLIRHKISDKDVVIGIAASGYTPYVVGGLKHCKQNNITTGCITCNPGAPVTEFADYPITVITGPEFVTGSTRMKAGTAQKMVLNMISTAVMIKLGRVKGNKMVDMQLSNNKLIERGTLMIMETLKVGRKEAADMLNEYGSVRKAVDAFKRKQENNNAGY
jgi:N-acetylmuramic acid 6-phosphate etherase